MTNPMTEAYNKLTDEEKKMADKITQEILSDPQESPPEFEKLFWENWKDLLA